MGRDGLLSAASLIVGGAAAADAVRRARRMPRLRVGLHLTLVDDWPILPAEAIPDLVVKTGPLAGRLRNDLASLGLAIATRPSVRVQIRSEIRAQFEDYRATGLALSPGCASAAAVVMDRADKARGSVYRIDPAERSEDSAELDVAAPPTCEAPPDQPERAASQRSRRAA